MGMSCAEALESHERNRKAGTWLMYVPPEGGESWRIVWIACLSAVSKIQCPPNIVGLRAWEGLSMKTWYTVVLSMIAGAALGSAAIQALHAQAKPPVYLVTEIDVTNPDAYAKEFAQGSGDHQSGR